MMNSDVKQNLLNQMYSRIRLEEANNLKTSKYSDADMVKLIVQIIRKVIKEDGNEI